MSKAKDELALAITRAEESIEVALAAIHQAQDELHRKHAIAQAEIAVAEVRRLATE